MQRRKSIRINACLANRTDVIAGFWRSSRQTRVTDSDDDDDSGKDPDGNGGEGYHDGDDDVNDEDDGVAYPFPSPIILDIEGPRALPYRVSRIEKGVFAAGAVTACRTMINLPQDASDIEEFLLGGHMSALLRIKVRAMCVYEIIFFS